MVARGFSLIEVMMAAVIGIIVGAIAVQATVMTNASIDRIRKQGPVQADARLLNDFLFEQVQEAGGGFVRPWHAVQIDDGCSASAGLPTCGGAGASDRIRVFSTSDTRAPCEITAKSATSMTANAIDTNGDLTLDTCCPVANNFSNQVIALTDPLDSKKVEFYNAGTLGTAVGSCTIQLLNGGALVVGMPNVAIPPGGITLATPAQVTAGRVSVYQIEASTLTAGTKDLVRYDDTDNNNTYAVGEKTVMAARVYDLQGALAYDGAPADGRLTEADTTTDEWVGTVASDVFPVGANTTQLRMARFGVIVGSPMPGAPAQNIKLLNRTVTISEPNMWLEAVVAAAYLRNTFLFDQ